MYTGYKELPVTFSPRRERPKLDWELRTVRCRWRPAPLILVTESLYCSHLAYFSLRKQCCPTAEIWYFTL